MSVLPRYIPIFILQAKKIIRNKVHTRIKMTWHDSLKCVLPFSILASEKKQV